MMNETEKAIKDLIFVRTHLDDDSQIAKSYDIAIKALEQKRCDKGGYMLFELLDKVNENTGIDIYAECTGTKIASFDSPSEVDDYYMDDDVTDVFVSENRLCVEIAIEPDMDYEDDI